MKKIFVLIFCLLLLNFVSAKDCSVAFDNMRINQSIQFCSDTFDLENGIKIYTSNIVLDCSTAVLRGLPGKSEFGIWLENVSNVTIRNCNIVTYGIGLVMKNATHCLIEDNGFLKGRIGIRMFDSFENVIQDNVDKSYKLAISALNSKFNTVILNNKNIEEGFCDVNICNKHEDVNPCVDDDFYCSKKCSPANDNDCGPQTSFSLANSSITEELEALEESYVDDLVKESVVEEKDEDIDFSFSALLFFAIIIYMISFFIRREYLSFIEKRSGN